MEYISFTIDFFDQSLALWEKTPGIGLSEGDDKASMAGYLKRNEGLSFLAVDKGEVVGTILAGHDGRRGAIYHLCVDESRRKEGIGRRLLELSLEALSQVGIPKVHVMVFAANETGLSWWTGQKEGRKRDDLSLVTLFPRKGGTDVSGTC